MKKTSLSALVAAGLLAGGLPMTNAYAADLGGNCCADLEERIAELEATTVRKGNRKVSLTISGWVAEQVFWWDDGEESNVYVSGVGTTLSSHFKLTGEAKIREGLSAGYVLHVEVNSNDPFFLSQDTDDSGVISLNDVGTGVRALQSYWFLKDDRWGKVSVGRLSQASDNTAILVDGSGSLVPANWVMFDGAGFFIRDDRTGLLSNVTFGSVGFCHQTSLPIGADCTGVPLNAVRYDTPTYMGFSVSADWGEDDFWDVAARYAGEFNGIKVAAAAAFSNSTDENTATGMGAVGAIPKRDTDYFQIGAYVQHVPTGLFLYGAYGIEDVDNVYAVGFVLDDNPDHWYVKAGIRQRWTPLGHTVLYGEYGMHNDQLNPAVTLIGDTESELKRWGVGVVQEVDAAAMSLWLAYRGMDAEIDNVDPAFDLDGETLHIVKFGALINF
jgi:hypothetical protein